MTTEEIRQKFLNFFITKNHTLKASSSLIPHNDKTLLFVNSGMVPFKDVFMGTKQTNYTKAVSCQKCLRAGGKHNDLENVGYTARHHTFFEMLGNFAFGAYFKKEAIALAWEFLTVELKIPQEKLWVSVYEEDKESEQIWIKNIGFPKDRISRCGAEDNFWQMADTGPCGPCSEIFYDHGSHIFGGPPGSKNQDGDRFVEIWNLVFTQFDKQKNGSLRLLAKPCVDTGMGLERIASVMQNKHNNYDTDILHSLCTKIVKIAAKNNDIKITNPSVRVIADHIRSTSFLISDGVVPDNEGRGYVLRRIIRRALRHGHKLKIDKFFFYSLSLTVAEHYKTIYPELQKNIKQIKLTIEKEEKQFAKTLNSGMLVLDQEIKKLSSNTLSGRIAFKLYDTYGFPYDLSADVAREHNITIDKTGFDEAMLQQKQQARMANKFKVEENAIINHTTKFVGYQQHECQTKIIAIIQQKNKVQKIADDNAILVLDKTPFYAESGGQIGDTGVIINADSKFIVNDTQQQNTNAYLHFGKVVSGEFMVGDKVTAIINVKKRECIKRNHSATHLLHAALQKILGDHVVQKGSLVSADKLRFDFTYYKPIQKKQLLAIEKLVNSKILENTKTQTKIMSLQDAKNQKAMALFDYRYDDRVRVLQMGSDNFSLELCGGTHVDMLGDIGIFRIINENAIASGVRRIEAVTANEAHEFDIKNRETLAILAKKLKSNNIQNKIDTLLATQKQLNNQVAMLQKKINANVINDLILMAKKVNSIKILSTKIDNIDSKNLLDLIDQLKIKLETAIIVLAVVNNNSVNLAGGITKNLTNKYNAVDIVNKVASRVNGKAGGRIDMAQGGGNKIDALNEALASVFDI